MNLIKTTDTYKNANRPNFDHLSSPFEPMFVIIHLTKLRKRSPIVVRSKFVFYLILRVPAAEGGRCRRCRRAGATSPLTRFRPQWPIRVASRRAQCLSLSTSAAISHWCASSPTAPSSLNASRILICRFLQSRIESRPVLTIFLEHDSDSVGLKLDTFTLCSVGNTNSIAPQVIRVTILCDLMITVTVLVAVSRDFARKNTLKLKILTWPAVANLVLRFTI